MPPKSAKPRPIYKYILLPLPAHVVQTPYPVLDNEIPSLVFAPEKKNYYYSDKAVLARKNQFCGGAKIPTM